MTLIVIRGIPKREKRAAVNDVKEYTKIPEIFTTMEEWPKKCNMLCYTCTAVIGTVPLFIPASIEETGIPRFDTTIYCSPSCTVSKINTLSNKSLYLKYLRILIQRMIDVYIVMLESSEDRSVINIYGGVLQSHVYQERIRELNSEWFDAVEKISQLKF